jgi:hypothetical protein
MIDELRGAEFGISFHNFVECCIFVKYGVFFDRMHPFERNYACIFPLPQNLPEPQKAFKQERTGPGFCGFSWQSGRARIKKYD